MTPLSNLSMRSQIISFVMAVVLFTALLKTIISIYQGYENQKNTILEESKTAINTLKNILAPYINAADTAGARNILSNNLHFNPNILQTTLTAKNSLLVSHTNSSYNQSAVEFKLNNGVHWQPDKLLIIEEIDTKSNLAPVKIYLWISTAKINAYTGNILNQEIIGLLLILAFAFVITYFSQSIVTQPIQNLANIAKEALHSRNLTPSATNEIDLIDQSLHKMLELTHNQTLEIQEMKRTLEQKVTAKTAELTSAKEKAEELAAAAQLAKEKALEMAAKFEMQQKLDSELAKFADLLRTNLSDDLIRWGNRLLTNLIITTNGAQAALYYLHTDIHKKTDSNNINAHEHSLEFICGYAITPDNTLLERLKKQEGLLEVVISRKTIIFFDNIPQGYITVRTGLGQLIATGITLVPLIAEDEVQGIIEIITVQPLAESQLELLKRLAPNIGSTLLILKNRENIERLLQESRAINEQLKINEQKLQHVNENLEQIVSERTRELQQTLENLKLTQEQLIQSEKMASLGQLIAGIAHEINTPIGAIKASAGNMQDVLPGVLQGIPRIIPKLTPLLQNQLMRLFDESLKPHKSLSSREERAIRKQIQTLLNNYGLANADDLARKLVEIGITENIEQFIELLKADETGEISDLFYKFGQVHINLENIETASEKTKKIVFALKSYTHRNTTDQLIPTSLVENIDLILTIYHNQLKAGIELTKNVDPNIYILCNPDELGQVWTNIIHNAIQAMNGIGEMTLNIFQENNNAVVEIIDSGPGIPPEIQARIFEPFFTTKPQGEGSGLGLDISRRIIEKHQGVIEVDSVPGRTCFRIKLPILKENNIN